MRFMLKLCEELGMTAEELAGRMTAAELRLWEAEYFLRDEDRRDQELLMRAKQRVGRA